MDARTEIEIRHLERMATLKEGQADEREATSAPLLGGGSSWYIRSLDIAEGYRTEAKDLRAEADRMRRAASK